MKIENELITGLTSDPQQLKKTSAAQPETDFAALLSDELAQGQSAVQLALGLKDINPLLGLTGAGALNGLTESQPSAAFSDQENQFMDELGGLLDVVDTYSLALAGQNGEQQSNLKSVYNILDAVSRKAQELKGALTEMGDNPVLAGIVNELEVMAATEKFKLNRGDYLT